jgi:hypothetical protein
MQTPEQRRARRDFDQRVEAEADERDAPGDQAGGDGDDRFE